MRLTETFTLEDARNVILKEKNQFKITQIRAPLRLLQEKHVGALFLTRQRRRRLYSIDIDQVNKAFDQAMKKYAK
jgi:hypothetical protein